MHISLINYTIYLFITIIVVVLIAVSRAAAGRIKTIVAVDTKSVGHERRSLICSWPCHLFAPPLAVTCSAPYVYRTRPRGRVAWQSCQSQHATRPGPCDLSVYNVPRRCLASFRCRRRTARRSASRSTCCKQRWTARSVRHTCDDPPNLTTIARVDEP